MAIKLKLTVVQLSLFIWVILSIHAKGQDDKVKFTHFYIDYPMLPATNGTGAFTVNDFDNDGDMDITLQNQANGKVYWYQKVGPEHWVKYEIASDVYYELGATTIDVNKDGKFDLVMGSCWLENPGNLQDIPSQLWIRHAYNGAMVKGENHDIVSADINHDGKVDFVAYNQKFRDDGGTLRWYDVSNPKEFKYHDIDTFINKREMPAWNNGIHAGFAPHGIGDLNNDDWADIVLPSGWYENPRNEDGNWVLHRWTDYGFKVGKPITPYGTSMRSWICDLNNDGNNDVVISDCDVSDGKPYIIYNIDGGKQFRLEPLPFLDGPSGSLHSLGVADMDGDGDLDIFSGEQEDGDNNMKPVRFSERGMLWINKGPAEKPVFEIQYINIDNPGWHETILKDMDGDGDIDMVTKVWNADAGTDVNPDQKWHVSYWRNESNRKSISAKSL